ncbi:hypothetical protein K2P56_02745 [Patescibacteria group bacterium]|nr:hypothetical protein [Patescibacteria group bacterium]
MRIAIALSILCLAAFTAHAVSYSNDTNSVDIDYLGPAPIGMPDSNAPEGGGGSDGGGAGSDAPVTPGNLWDANNVTVTVSTQGSSTTGTGGDAEGDSESSSEVLDGEDILASLFGNQALSISGSAHGGEHTVRLNGKKAREALKARGITKLSIVNRFTSKFLTKKDFALMAVSDILENENIEDVILSLNTVELTYRSQGRLFAVFPMAFPITVTVNPYANTSDARVVVKFPWYSFFMQKFVSKEGLARDINASIDATDISDTEPIDARGMFLSAITQVILLRGDTVEGTLR